MPETCPPSKNALSAAISVAGIAGVGVVDYLTGFDVNLSVFYALPVIFGVWFAGRGVGTFDALLAGAAWLFADRFSGHRYSAEWIPIWNACVRFTFLMLIVHGAYYTRRQVQQSRARSNVLEQALPVCNCCKKIRDEDGAWLDVETYVMEHLSTQPAQKLCPDCAKRVYIQRVSPRETPPLHA